MKTLLLILMTTSSSLTLALPGVQSVTHPVTGLQVKLDKLENLADPTEVFPQPFGLKYYLACHESLAQKIEADKRAQENCQDPIPLPELGSLKPLSSDLSMETFKTYQERESQPEFQKMLAECHKEQERFHTDIARLTVESYDISFLDRNNPNLENQREGQPQEGYRVEKYYGNNPEECFQTGLKAALFIPNEGDHVVFAVTGTEGSETYSSGKKRETYLSTNPSMLGWLSHKKPVGQEVSANEKDKEDWAPVVGKRQFSSSCGQQMIADAMEYATKHNKKIVFTGHSLGGAISQGMGHELQKRLLKQDPNAPSVHVVSFMSAGGAGVSGKSSPLIQERLNSVIYASLGDIVSVTGNHVGEIREMVRTEEYENEFKEFKKPVLRTHDLDLSGFRPLGESIHVTGPELGQHFMQYMQSYSKPKKEAP